MDTDTEAIKNEVIKGVPNVSELHDTFEKIQSDLNVYRRNQDDGFNVRFCKWTNQSDDFKKKGENAFPYKDASDQRIPMVDEAIDYDVALLMTALRKAKLIAIPVNSNDIKRSRLASNYMTWMKEAQIEELYHEAKVAANNYCQKGIMITGQFYKKNVEKIKTLVDLNSLSQEIPGFGEAILTQNRAEAEKLFVEYFTLLDENEAEEAFNALIETGKVEVPRYSVKVDRPVVNTFIPDQEVFMPMDVTCIQSSPVIYIVERLLVDEIKERQLTDGWDPGWVKWVVENHPFDTNTSLLADDLSQLLYNEASDELSSEENQKVLVVTAYQKIADEHNVTGIYETVYTPGLTTEMNKVQPYAKSELLGYAHGEYPFKATTLDNFSKKLYETRGYAEKGKGFQNQYKIEVDATVDQSSLTTNPPMTGPPGKRPSKFGPNTYIPQTPGLADIKLMDLPQNLQSTREVREIIRLEFDRYFGRSNAQIDAQENRTKKQELVSSFLSHWKDVFKQLYVLNRQFGPEERTFRVLGTADVQTFKFDPNEQFDFYFDFDLLNNDPEMVEKRLTATTEYLRIPGVNINTERLREIGLSSIDPVLAEAVLEPDSQASSKAIADERQLLAQIFAGIPADVDEMDPANRIKLQEDMNYLRQPDVQRRMQSDEIFAKRMEILISQRQHIEEQNVNAERGRFGGKLQSEVQPQEELLLAGNG